MGYRYIGAKNKLKDHILKEISNIIGPSGHVVDMMSGTGQVSRFLREAGYKVTAVDVMTYSFHHAKVQLFINKAPLFRELEEMKEIKCIKKNTENLFGITNYEAVLTYLNDIEPEKGYLWKECSPGGKPKNGENPRKYFTEENACKIDTIREKIENWKQNKKISDLEESLLIHDLILAANDIANIAGTYGHYLSKIIQRAKDPMVMKPFNFASDSNVEHHKVIKGYAEKTAEYIQADLCYIDPPYMKRQYAANYHILETIAVGDAPEAAGVSGLRPWRNQYSNFCSKIKIRDAFIEIIEKMDCQHFLISYSEDGLLSADELKNLLDKFGNVKIQNIKYKRFKSNDSKLGSQLNEYLIHLEKSIQIFPRAKHSQQYEHAQGAM